MSEKKGSSKHEYANLIIQEIIKSILLIVVAFIAVTFWEKQKVINEISYTKKLEIITQERNQLMEDADRFSENWNKLVEYSNSGNCSASPTFRSSLNDIQRVTQKTDLILANTLLKKEDISPLQTSLASKSKLLFEALVQCKLNENDYKELTTIYDNITLAYTKEITKDFR